MGQFTKLLTSIAAAALHIGFLVRGGATIGKLYHAQGVVLAKKIYDSADRLAVWVLDISKQNHFPKLKVVNVPGGNNTNLAAQSGRFTLLEQQGVRGAPFEGETSLDLYLMGQPLPAPLMKVTLPVTEAHAALKLCSLYGVTGATLFPDYYGAARATEDPMNTEPGSL